MVASVKVKKITYLSMNRTTRETYLKLCYTALVQTTGQKASVEVKCILAVQVKQI